MATHLERVVAHLDVQVDDVELPVSELRREGDEEHYVHHPEQRHQNQNELGQFSENS